MAVTSDPSIEMFDQQKSDWRQFKQDQPGTRFRHAYRRRQARRGGWSLSRILLVGLAALLILSGPVVGLIPGPGGLFVFVGGLLLLTSQVYWAAALADWFEPLGRRFCEGVKRIWVSAPLPTRIAMGVVAFTLVGLFVYVGYRYGSGTS